MDDIILETVRRSPGLTASAIVTLLRKNEPAVSRSHVNRALYKAARTKLCVARGDPPRWTYVAAEGKAAGAAPAAPAAALPDLERQRARLRGAYLRLVPPGLSRHDARLRASYLQCLAAFGEFAELAGMPPLLSTVAGAQELLAGVPAAAASDDSASDSDEPEAAPATTDAPGSDIE